MKQEKASMDDEQRLDRLNGVCTAITCALLPVIAHSAPHTKHAVQEALQDIVDRQGDDSPATDAARSFAQGLLDEITRTS